LRKAKNTYENTINCVKTNRGWSPWFETLVVREGCVLAPVLFNVMMNETHRKYERNRFKSL
jgi:hypothetical protein